MANSSPEHDSRVQAVIDAVQNFDLTESSSWSDLDALSTHTYVDEIEVDPEGVILEPESRFRGTMSVYVLLKYESEGEDGFETSDGFRGRFNGHFEAEAKPVIDDIEVDTSSFYEGESGMN